jgi:serine/threonine protein kinase
MSKPLTVLRRTDGDRTPYRILGLVGYGQFGRVYCALDQDSQELVALKEVTLSRFPTKEFIRELRYLAELHHPQIVGYRGLDFCGQERYLVMDYCNGGTLRQLMNSGYPLSIGQCLELLSDVLLALQQVHGQGIIHCDIKPENILLSLTDSGWKAHVADFGIAQLLQDVNQGQGKCHGAPAYMAPECFYGQATYSSDLYALGIVLYELVVGDRPFDGTPADLLEAHFNQSVQVPEPVPFLLRSILQRALQKLPQNRYLTAQEMLKAVQLAREVLASEPVIHLPPVAPAADLTVEATAEPLLAVQQTIAIQSPVTLIAVRGDDLVLFEAQHWSRWNLEESEPQCEDTAALPAFPAPLVHCRWEGNQLILRTQIHLAEKCDRSRTHFYELTLASTPLKAPTTLTPLPVFPIPQHWPEGGTPIAIHCLDKRHGVAFVSLPDDNGNEAIQLHYFTRRNPQGPTTNLPPLALVTLPISSERVVPTQSKGFFLVVDRQVPNHALLVQIFPYRLQRLVLPWIPDWLERTWWGFLAMTHQGHCCCFDPDWQVLTEWQIPLAPSERVEAIATDASTLAVATWGEEQGQVHLISLDAITAL